jgi:hypothetical protein
MRVNFFDQTAPVRAVEHKRFRYHIHNCVQSHVQDIETRTRKRLDARQRSEANVTEQNGRDCAPQ